MINPRLDASLQQETPKDISQYHISGKLDSDSLKVLHFWNTAGVGGYIAKYMDQYCGTQSLAVMRKSCDPFNLMQKGKVYDERAAIFVLRRILAARKFDVLHIHSSEKFIRFLKVIYPKKKIILHYHGTRIRGKWKEKKKYWSYADEILVSTPDLLEGAPKNTIYVPNIIDEDLFSAFSHNQKMCAAFHVDRFASDIAKKYATKYNLELVIYNRDKNPLDHNEFAKKISQYEYYIDVKRDFHDGKKILQATSLTGFEALFSGSILIDWKGNMITSYPEDHRAENVVRRLYKIYTEH